MRIKKVLALVLAAGLLWGLCGCGRSGAAEESVREALIPGWLPRELPLPEGMRFGQDFTLEDGALILGGVGEEGAVIACLDPETERWTAIPYDRASYPGLDLCRLGAAGGTVWALLDQPDRQSGSMTYYLLRWERDGDAAATLARLDFDPGGNSEGSPVFCGVYGLDGERAIVYDFNYGYLLDGEARLLQRFELRGLNYDSYTRADGETRLFWYENGGAGPLPPGGRRPLRHGAGGAARGLRGPLYQRERALSCQ